MVENYLRRVVCLPPIGETALATGRPEPHALRQALYPLVLLYTAAYLGLELREFASGTASRFLSPEMYMAAIYKQVIVVFFG